MRKVGILFLIILAGVFAFPVIKEAESGAGENVSGFAWSENIGWLSFNNTFDGGSVSYGVSVDFGNGKLSGYAWSEHIGWISFNEANTGAPPSNDPCSDSSCIAKVTPSGRLGIENVPVYGWARALSYGGGWDGWIRFDHNKSGTVYIDSNGDFHGWAWGSDVVGWLSFNSTDAGAGGASYKVILNLTGVNYPPSATGLSVTQGDYCPASYPPIYLSWTFSDSGDTQSAYQVQIDNNFNFSSPEKDSGKVTSSSNTYAPPNLSYNATYYWRLKVWDSQDVSSGWIVYQDNTAPPESFTTARHAYPFIDFSWQPQFPAVDELVQFADQSTVDGGVTKSSWLWTFQDGSPVSSTQQNPTASFTPTGSKQVSLKVTDSDGYFCTGSQSVSVQLPFPEWKEITPF